MPWKTGTRRGKWNNDAILLDLVLDLTRTDPDMIHLKREAIFLYHNEG